MSNAQTYDKKVTASALNIEDKVIKGFSTSLSFELKDVKKSFWRYCQDFSKMTNKKKFYEVIIPEETNEGNSDLIIYAIITGDEKKSTLKMGLSTQGIPSDKFGKYNEQTKSILVEFKRGHYLNYYQQLIDLKLKESKKLGKNYEKLQAKPDRLPEANKVLSELKAIDLEIEKLRKLQLSI